MNNTVVNLILTLARFLPFLAFVLLNAKANLKKPFRSRQFPMRGGQRGKGCVRGM
jgi:hypothetical protein